jgi:hypothetical protein
VTLLFYIFIILFIAIMDSYLRDKIIEVFPAYSESEIYSLITALKAAGVDGEDDLKFMKAEDLSHILPPIKCRRLIAAFIGEGANEQVSKNDSATPTSSSNSNLLASPSSHDDWANRFIVNWNKMSDSLMDSLRNECRPCETDIRQMIAIIMADIFGFTRKPTRKELRCVARKVVSQ